MKPDDFLESEVWTSHARWGERLVQRKPISYFQLRDETTDDEIIEVKAFQGEDEFDESNLVSNAILGLQLIKEQPSITKVLLEEEKKKLSSVRSPSNLVETLK